MFEHQEFVFGLIIAIAPVLLPKVNQALASLTGNEYIKKGFAIAKLLENGLTVDEITEELLKSKIKTML